MACKDPALQALLVDLPFLLLGLHIFLRTCWFLLHASCYSHQLQCVLPSLLVESTKSTRSYQETAVCKSHHMGPCLRILFCTRMLVKKSHVLALADTFYKSLYSLQLDHILFLTAPSLVPYHTLHHSL
ncbi:hypothetical protein MnTg01_00034 [archaeon MnTg01]|nr:hypothetical protein MnTg01_00034 [archaeon MnTg01]